MHLAYAWRLLARRVAVLLLAALVGAMLGQFYFRARAGYTTTAHLLVSPAENQAGIRAAEPERFFKTQMQRLLSDDVMNPAAQRVGTTASELRAAVNLTGGTTDDILAVSVTGSTSDQVGRWTDALLAQATAAGGTDAKIQILWRDPAYSNISRTQAVTRGGALAAGMAALAILGIGAIRRPILAAKYANFGDMEGQVYVLPGGRSRGDRAGEDALRDFFDWLKRGASTPTVDVRVLDVATRPETQALADRLRSMALAASSGGGELSMHPASSDVAAHPGDRVLVALGVLGVTTEPDIELSVELHRTDGERVVVLLTRANRGR